jgi:hypothetical protein
MEPSYFEVIFSKSGLLQDEYWRVCIELDDRDKALLKSKVSVELKTRFIVWRAKVLDLLPVGLDDYWPRFGSVLQHSAIGTWDGNSKPAISKSGHKVWVMPGGVNWLR